MSANLDPEEVDALLQPGASAVSEVAERDFRQPRRLSPERLVAFETVLGRAVPDFGESLGAHFEQPLFASISSTREALADELHDHLPDPFVAAEFAVANQVAWLSLDAIFASRLVERMLGGPGIVETPQDLSQTEVRLFIAFLTKTLAELLEGLGGELGPIGIHQESTTLGSWSDAGNDADAHRIVADLTLTVGETNYSLELWLPGSLAPGPPSANAVAGAVPRHLVPIDLTLTVELAGSEVSLEELLALEVGDVIPLEAKLGDPAQLTLDGRPIASGQLGQRNGLLAARILAFDGQQGPESKETANGPDSSPPNESI